MLSNSSGHGFSNLVSNKSCFVKKIGTLSILASITGCIIFIHGIFITNITNVKVRERFSIDFPAVTICAFNQSYKVIENLNLTSINEFTFSQKPGDWSALEEIKVLAAGVNQTCVVFNYKDNFSKKEFIKATEPGWTLWYWRSIYHQI